MNKKFEFKSIFKDELRDFINHKRSQGYKYDEKTCNDFLILDNFFINESLNEKIIGIEIIEKWLKRNQQLSFLTKQKKYSAISMFAKYLIHKNYPNIKVLEKNPYKGRHQFTPYIYTKDELKNIFEKSKNNRLLYVALHLFYNCGMRISEVTNLKAKDLILQDKSIFIENSKNNKSRLIPLTDFIFEIVKEYINSQNIDNENYIFSNSLKRENVKNYYIRVPFHKIQNDIGMNKRENGHFPRIHDLRHTFAVHALNQMQEKGMDLYVTLPILSVYMGHESIIETEYYLRFILNYSDKILTSNNYVKGIYIEKDLYNEE